MNTQFLKMLLQMIKFWRISWLIFWCKITHKIISKLLFWLTSFYASMNKNISTKVRIWIFCAQNNLKNSYFEYFDDIFMSKYIENILEIILTVISELKIFNNECYIIINVCCYWREFWISILIKNENSTDWEWKIAFIVVSVI